jgi:hypothetical protein
LRWFRLVEAVNTPQILSKKTLEKWLEHQNHAKSHPHTSACKETEW